MQVMLTACEQDQDGSEFHPDPAGKLSANLYDIPVPCLQWKTRDDGQRKCPKYLEFHSKNKFEKLVHLVGFIITIFHDPWSRERQMHSNSSALSPSFVSSQPKFPVANWLTKRIYHSEACSGFEPEMPVTVSELCHAFC